MSYTAAQKKHLRRLRQRVDAAGSAVTQLAAAHQAAICQHGIAHPRSVDAGRRLSRTRAEHRRMAGAYAVALGAEKP